MTERDLPSRGQPGNPEDVAYAEAVPAVVPGIEDPRDDFVEQRLGGEEEEPEEPPPDEAVLPAADEADAAEQRAGTRTDDDEYR